MMWRPMWMLVLLASVDLSAAPAPVRQLRHRAEGDGGEEIGQEIGFAEPRELLDARIKVGDYVKELQPLWTLLLAVPIKTVLTVVVFGFGDIQFSKDDGTRDLAAKEVGASPRCDLGALMGAAARWTFLALAVKTLYQDIMKIIQFDPQNAYELAISLTLVISTSSNFMSACSAVTSQSPEERIFGVKPNPRSTRTIGLEKKAYSKMMEIYLGVTKHSVNLMCLVGVSACFLGIKPMTQQEMDALVNVPFLLKFFYVYLLVLAVPPLANLASIAFCCWKVGVTGTRIVLPKFLQLLSREKGEKTQETMQLLARDIQLWELQTPEFQSLFTTYHQLEDRDCDPEVEESLCKVDFDAQKGQAEKALLLQMLLLAKTCRDGLTAALFLQMMGLMAVRLWQIPHPHFLDLYKVFGKIWSDRTLQQYWQGIWAPAQSSVVGMLDSISKFAWQL